MKTPMRWICSFVVLFIALGFVSLTRSQNMPAVNSIPSGCTSSPVLLKFTGGQWQCTPAVLNATTAAIGGAALALGTCSTGTVNVPGAIVGHQVGVTPDTYPGDGMFWDGYVSAAGVVTVKVCATVLGAPTASVYYVRVIQ